MARMEIYMGLNETVAAERPHIAFFGVRNAGKSSVVNAVTGQELAVVSDVGGTTTDPVKKTMELLPLGPVVIVDTPGIDDGGRLGDLRVKKAKQALGYTDIAVLVVDAQRGMTEYDRDLTEAFVARGIPYVIAYNKSDLLEAVPEPSGSAIYVSAKDGAGIYALKEMIARLAGETRSEKRLVADLLSPGDTVVLVVPIDKAAPKGRLILPQQQVIRDVLEAGCSAVVCRDTELEKTLSSLAVKPRLVITDSQAFGSVSKAVPSDMTLTSFSILFARYKGELEALLSGVAKLAELRDGDRVLISEGCTHHRQCDDIGAVKLPRWVEGYTGKKLTFEFSSGGAFPEGDELKKYALVIHCGACMLNEREMRSRIERAHEAGIPITNYGMTIAEVHGVLRRSLEPFPYLKAIVE